MTRKGWMKLITALIVVVLVLILIFQNLSATGVRVLLWRPNMPLALLLIIMFLLGFVGGILTLAYVNTRREQKQKK